MTDAAWIGVIGVVLIILQIVMTYTFWGVKNQVKGLRSDMKELWERANTHGHAIDCDTAGCKPRTVGVLIQDRRLES